MAQDTFFSSKKTLNLRGNLISLDSPLVMGILNVTPDSFYSGSRVKEDSSAISIANKMVKDGASILDIGGYSSRPGADDISAQEEIDRVVPVIELIKSTLQDTYISIDTFRSSVAREAVKAGADIINDISGGNLDKDMFDTVTQLKVPYILMHMKGTPQTMKEEAHYENMVLEMLDYFQGKISDLQSRGIKDVIIDPGFGFAKNIEQNFQLLKSLNAFKMLELPMLIGLSRKSMIYKSLNTDAGQALNGTTALNMIALQQGANILRVHDVKEAVETVKLFNLTYVN
ncbi:dihydropteroate synthase [Fulvivirga lutimaris]|uniref:dihydropteroate synthase n=1 Tax=Fulvivirga lutimaris TaxID=1819566 RepID=UPI0031B5B80D